VTLKTTQYSMTKLRTQSDEVKNNTVFSDEIRYKIEVRKTIFLL